jgi:hypothetical protein
MNDFHQQQKVRKRKKRRKRVYRIVGSSLQSYSISWPIYHLEASALASSIISIGIKTSMNETIHRNIEGTNV